MANVSLKSMQYFNTAVSFGSISKAAEHLNIAASAVSAAIDQVEATFELTLLNRQRSRGISANANGRVIAQKFERLLEDYQAILSDGIELKRSLSGTLTIGYYAPVAPAFLPDVFQSFLPKDSKVVLHLRECDNDSVQEGLLNGDFDVILFVSDEAKASIEFDVLLEAPPYCLLPKSHALAARKSISMAEIASEDLIVLDRPVVASYYQHLFTGFSQDINIIAYANSTEMVRSLVSRGLGCAVLNMQPRTDISYSGGDLVCLPIEDQLLPLTLAVAYDRNRPRRIVEEFVRSFALHFAEDGNAYRVVSSR